MNNLTPLEALNKLNDIKNALFLTDEETVGAKRVLSAAAMTYVAATAVSLAQILRLLILFGGGNRRRND